MKGKKILKVIFDVIIWVVIVLAASVTLITLTSREKGVSQIFGYIPLNIQTGSMEPTIMSGDLIITKAFDKDKDTLKENDVISFFSIEQNTTIIKTHRIKSVNTINGMTSYVTQGDNNSAEDSQQVAPGDVISVWNGFRIPVLGNVLTFLKTKVGFFICIIIPLAAFFIYQLYKFIMLLLDYKKVK